MPEYRIVSPVLLVGGFEAFVKKKRSNFVIQKPSSTNLTNEGSIIFVWIAS